MPNRSWHTHSAAYQQTTQRRFSFLRWYSALSLACIASVAVGASFFLTQFFKTHMLERDAVVGMEFINSIVRADATWSSFEEAARRFPGAHGEVLDAFFRHVARMPSVARANVYAADRTVLWSSNPGIIGQRFADNDDLDSALAGRIALDWGVAGRHDKEEHVGLEERGAGTRFVEAYLPIWSRDRASVIGVVEIYKLPKQLFEAIDKGERYIWASGVLGALLLYTSLLWVVSRASNIVREQEAKLVEAETFAAIGEMASAVAHGIRNPLAAMRSSAEVARLEDNPPPTDECLSDIIGQVDRAEAWVGDLLAFSRSGESGETAAGAESVDLGSVVTEVVADLAGTLDRQRIVTEISAKGLPPVSANPAQLRQALGIIIDNAIEAMPDGGRLTVSGRWLPAEDRVELRITDTGPGLRPALVTEVFRPFFSTKPSGTGLGLTLARRIVDRYSGTLHFASTEGKGSTMTMTVPCMAAPAATGN